MNRRSRQASILKAQKFQPKLVLKRLNMRLKKFGQRLILVAKIMASSLQEGGRKAVQANNN
jgi:hypothetical protein